MSKVIYRASRWDRQDSYIGNTKRRLDDRKTKQFKVITSNCHASFNADHVTSIGPNLKWDTFKFLTGGRSDTYCEIEDTLLIRNLELSLNDDGNVVKKKKIEHNNFQKGKREQNESTRAERFPRF